MQEEQEQKQITIDDVVDTITTMLIDIKKNFKHLIAYYEKATARIKELESKPTEDDSNDQ